jgi:hypothetical protein
MERIFLSDYILMVGRVCWSASSGEAFSNTGANVMNTSISKASAIIFLPVFSSAFVIHDLGIVTALLFPRSIMLLIIGMFIPSLCVVVHKHVYI